MMGTGRRVRGFGERGFTVVEIMLALLVMTILLTELVHQLPAIVKGGRSAEARTLAVLAAQDEMEELKSMGAATPAAGQFKPGVGGGVPAGRWKGSWKVRRAGPLREITVTVRWGQAGREEVVLATLAAAR